MTATEELKIKWHPAFYSVLECILREVRAMLEFRREHSLSKEPIRMDLLIIDEMAVAKTKADCCRPVAIRLTKGIREYIIFMEIRCFRSR